mmetsp:Transcript_34470/g.55306  ORF Transcript_34470/g.55306 Transcript_34470/m.55306 type:complete len:280 (+) Transcript_34470:525-1364(+)
MQCLQCTQCMCCCLGFWRIHMRVLPNRGCWQVMRPTTRCSPQTVAFILKIKADAIAHIAVCVAVCVAGYVYVCVCVCICIESRSRMCMHMHVRMRMRMRMCMWMWMRVRHNWCYVMAVAVGVAMRHCRVRRRRNGGRGGRKLIAFENVSHFHLSVAILSPCFLIESVVKPIGDVCVGRCPRFLSKTIQVEVHEVVVVGVHCHALLLHHEFQQFRINARPNNLVLLFLFLFPLIHCLRIKRNGRCSGSTHRSRGRGRGGGGGGGRRHSGRGRGSGSGAWC